MKEFGPGGGTFLAHPLDPPVYFPYWIVTITTKKFTRYAQKDQPTRCYCRSRAHVSLEAIFYGIRVFLKLSTTQECQYCQFCYQISSILTLYVANDQGNCNFFVNTILCVYEKPCSWKTLAVDKVAGQRHYNVRDSLGHWLKMYSHWT